MRGGSIDFAGRVCQAPGTRGAGEFHPPSGRRICLAGCFLCGRSPPSECGASSHRFQHALADAGDAQIPHRPRGDEEMRMLFDVIARVESAAWTLRTPKVGSAHSSLTRAGREFALSSTHDRAPTRRPTSVHDKRRVPHSQHSPGLTGEAEHRLAGFLSGLGAPEYLANRPGACKVQRSTHGDLSHRFQV